ncbi:MAG: hypothetical protein DYG94_06790 [Leptolyngbya sp. PLA3]|nr:MAG: hypothetical protein EDM82_06135 [Cyanobacteria bacterium CYA]MCE7968435.1 hypothetical protein [Leptolyngbya sp. PL-A3]
MLRIGVITIGLVLTPLLWAQDADPIDRSEAPADGTRSDPPTDTGVVTDPAVRASLGLPRMTQEAPPIRPVASDPLEPVQPGLTGGQDWLAGLAVRQTELPRPARLPEGIFLNTRPGQLWPGPGGMWIFLPDPEGRVPGEGAMILAPNQTLDRLAASLESQPVPASVNVSGRTLLYHDHNYLLLTDYTRRQQAPDSPEGAASPGDSAATPGQSAGVPESTPQPPTEVADLIADLQGAARAGTRRNDVLRERLLAADRAHNANEDVAPAGNPPLLPDGSYIAQRRARLERLSGGEWALTFDNDTQSLGDAPLVVIPGRTLMRMEARAGTARSMTMTVSGRVYAAKGRGYFLPVLFTVDPPSDVQPLQ